MVMHARKTQRMNDGYFEKHQTHPYQNSKYSSSKSYGSSSDRYERIRDSPNGNYRSDSPDSQSPRDTRDRDRDRSSSYQSSKSSYIQKIREKERENRDYKMPRDKYSDCARSPKDKRSRDSEHRTNNDRNEDKSILHPLKERERTIRVGDWTEHVSSSGKKYYYNCKTEVSQWEKPREWLERERVRYRSRDRDRDRDSDRCYSSSSSRSLRHDKHSNSRGANSSKDIARDSATSGGGGGGGSSSRHWNSSRMDDDMSSKESSRSSSRKHQRESDETMVQSSTTQDMDISPGDSTPTSEVSYQGNNSNQMGIACGATTSSASTDPVVATGPVLLANALPKLISHPPIHIPPSASMVAGIRGSTAAESSPQPQSTPTSMLVNSVTTSMAAVGPSLVTANNGGGVGIGGCNSLPRILSQTALTSDLTNISSSSSSIDKNLHGLQSRATCVVGGVGGVGPPDSAVYTSLSVDTSNHTGIVVEGPPTPTHAETPDCAKAVPVSSPPGSLPTLQGMSSSLQALRPQGPTITPSLANHYRDDLVNHVRGWPAEILEKQAQKLAEEAHIMGGIQCSKVSAELKSARSLVRLTEIQATLQEQRMLEQYFLSILIELKWIRFCVTNNVKCDNFDLLKEALMYFEQVGKHSDRILFLRQQIKELEELKSQNSFMSDDT